MGDTISEMGPRVDRAPRFSIPMSMRYRRRGDKAWRRGKVENVSRTGVLFSARLWMEPGAPVEMKLHLADAVGVPSAAQVFCKGNVVRTVPPSSISQKLSLAVNFQSYKLVPSLPV
jgi:hypothetical protein